MPRPVVCPIYVPHAMWIAYLDSEGTPANKIDSYCKELGYPRFGEEELAQFKEQHPDYRKMGKRTKLKWPIFNTSAWGWVTKAARDSFIRDRLNMFTLAKKPPELIAEYFNTYLSFPIPAACVVRYQYTYFNVVHVDRKDVASFFENFRDKVLGERYFRAFNGEAEQMIFKMGIIPEDYSLEKSLKNSFFAAYQKFMETTRLKEDGNQEGSIHAFRWGKVMSDMAWRLEKIETHREQLAKEGIAEVGALADFDYSEIPDLSEYHKMMKKNFDRKTDTELEELVEDEQ